MASNKFSKNAIEAINIANKTCIKLGSSYVVLEHLFIGILSITEGIGSRLLAKLGLDQQETIKSIEEELNQKTSIVEATVNGEKVTTEANSTQQITDVTVSDEIKRVFEKAFEIAINSGHNYIGTEHLLLGMLEVKDNIFVQELEKIGISYDRIKKELEEFVQYPDSQPLEKLQNGLLPPPPLTQGNRGRPEMGRNGGFFETYGRNLSEEARAGKLDPVIGREREIERLMQILSRRSKNNPILLGDAGVGKTAIVEGLAQRLAEGSVSPILASYEIWAVDIASIIAGSQLRGDVEQKILDLIHEVEQRKNVILFIDEIHTMMGAGATNNSSLDISNILKPALARGILHCIGATTVDEYRQHFDNDPALQRRFQPIDVDELTEEDTIKVLKNLKIVYETFHGVNLSDEALKAAVKLSNRYITDRFLPDKAIDLIDEACAKNKLERVQITPGFKKELNKLREVISMKNQALNEKNIELASQLLDNEKKIMKKLEQQEKKMKLGWDKGEKIITEKHIKSVIKAWTKIPLDSLSEDNTSLITRLDKELKGNIIGQDYACTLVSNSIKRAKAGLSGFDRPLASFLFVGPTGVGKTELAKQLAKSLFGSKEALIQVDMSELMESHSVSKLIGSPPGYVGYDQGGQLTDRVRRKQFSVILFDEIEKASPEVLNILLQILDEGKLTDSKGRMVNFKNTIVIMTSNIGSDLLRRETSVGLFLEEVSCKKRKKQSDRNNSVTNPMVLETQEKILDELKEYLQPEFINRIDDVVIFRELNKEDIENIAKLQVNKLVDRLKKESNIILQNADNKEIIKQVVESGFSEEYGAREIARVIRSSLENKVADKILELGWDADSKSTLELKVKLDKDNNFVVTERISAKA